MEITKQAGPNRSVAFLGGICGLMLFLGLNGCGKEQSGPSEVIQPANEVIQPAKEADSVPARMAAFCRSEASQISALIKNLKIAEASLQNKIHNYSYILEGLGRDLRDDSTLRAWEKLLGSMADDRLELEGKLKLAFLWSEKFRLAPSATHKAELVARIAEANSLIAEITQRYGELTDIKTNG